MLILATLFPWRGQFSAEPAVAPLVFVGDSVTAGWGASAMDRRFASIVDANAIVDAAPGATSAYFADRDWTADTVVIELGINDWVNGIRPFAFRAHVAAILRSVNAVRVILVVPYEVGGSRTGPWDVYADELIALGQSDERVTLVDLRTAFGEPSTALLGPDLVHPNDRGHLVIAAMIRRAME